MSNKNQQQFELLYKQCYPMVWQMCLGYVKGDKSLANDLSQEVFINIWKALEKFREASSYKTWIYRITVNTCLQYLRKEKNKVRLNLDRIENTLKEEPETKKDENHALYSAIGQLNEIDRLIIMMVLDEQEYADIADIIGINPTNLRVKIHRIKKRLKKIMSNE